MPEHSTISFEGGLRFARYKQISVSYAFCEAGIVIQPQPQQSMIDMMANEAGVKVDVHGSPLAIVPNISMLRTVGQWARSS